MENLTAYPLSWPAHWPRRKIGQRTRANFGRVETKQYSYSPNTYRQREQLTIAQALTRLRGELDRLAARDVVISTNVELRRDGLPMSGRREPDDPGVAVYFALSGQRRCLPCDRWDRTADNLAAVAKHIEAIRGMDRWGVGNVEAMFAGFKALPGGEGPTIRQAMTSGEAQALLDRYGGIKNAKLKTHPDRGGSAEEFARVMEAERVLGLEGGR